MADWEKRVTDTAARGAEGLRIERIGETELREFTRRHDTGGFTPAAHITLVET